jgi:GT2 family glycosyltransferase
MSAPAPVLAPVTVVIVNYNAGGLLGDCLAAALDQCRQVILVDNASAAGPLDAVLGRFAAEPRLEVVRSAVNRGFAAGCNLGLAQAREPIVLFLNPDCILAPGAVAALAAAIRSEPRVGMVGGLLTDVAGREQGGSRRAVPTPWRSFVRAFGLSRFANRWPRLFTDYDLHRQPLPTAPTAVEAVSGACTMVTRDAIDEVGGWDEGYFLHCEDLDLCMRFRARGWRILFVPAARAVHHRGQCGRTRPLFVEWHKHAGMVRFYRRHFRHQYPIGLMALVTCGVWLRFTAIAARLLVGRLGRALARIPGWIAHGWQSPRCAAAAATARSTGFALVEVIVVVAILGTLIALLLPAVQRARESARQTSCRNNLRNMGVGMANHETARRRFPLGCDHLTNRDHAWSSLILPYVEEVNLAAKIDYSKPWDDAPADGSPGNRTAADQIVPLYVCAAGIISYPGKQDYFGVAGIGMGAAGVPTPEYDPGAVATRIPQPQWATCGMLYHSDAANPHGVRAASVTDGLSRTLMTSESTDQGVWPSELENPELASTFGRWATSSSYLLNKQVVNDHRGEAFFSHHPGIVFALFADGHVAALDETIDPEVLTAISTRNGGEIATFR